MTTKIKDIPETERPRERLINYGVEYLSNEELIAIILKSGTKELSAKELALLILSQFKNEQEFQNIRYEQLIKIKGVGKAKACALISALEIGKRMNKTIKTLHNTKFNNPLLVYNYYFPILKDKKQEYFYCIYLDNKKNIIKDKLLFIGTINHSVIHPREIFKEAYLISASSFICVHNHPSGDPIPSKEDIEVTKNLFKISQILGIELVDHIIIGHNKYYSFFENENI